MASERETLKSVVGEEAYTVWINMLQELVPDGRTHRLAPMVAAMLQYAAVTAYRKYGDDAEEGSAASALLLASEAYDPEEATELLDQVKRLFEDAGVAYERVSRRGEKYSIAESAIYEFIHWEDMPWES
jgi:hypothetical protein